MKKPRLDTKKVSRLTVVNGEMIRTMVTKNKFSQLNDKTFYFPNRVVSLPFQHLSLAEIVEFKRIKGQKIEKYFWKEKKASATTRKYCTKKSRKAIFIPPNFNVCSKDI